MNAPDFPAAGLRRSADPRLAGGEAPITVLVCALGGEGGGVLTEWLYDAAVQAGHAAQCTSVPGVAQRTGATTYYIEIHPRAGSARAARRPVFSLNPVPGAIDLLISSELLETLRQVGNGLSHPQRTHVISSTARALTVAEKMQQADGRMDSAAMAGALQLHCASADLLDLEQLAREAGTVISAVLLGAVAASGRLPLPRAAYEDAIRRAGKGVQASLNGFARAFEIVAQRQQQRSLLQQALTPEQMPAQTPAPTPAPPTASAAPVALRGIARQRLAEYQDAGYVALYDERLQRIESAAGSGAAGVQSVAEVERWLALWMMFDDIVRVAALKLARSRQARVRGEVRAGEGEIVKIFDHFKPGLAEFAALLPARLAQALLRWDRRRVARGLDPWALPMKIGTHTVVGALALLCVAALKGQRRRGSRFALEQQLIERWLVATEAGLRADPGLGLELARCGQLIKGYGSTNERGKDNLLHIIDHLARGDAAAATRAQAVRQAREAALADDAGRALDQTLIAHGAPARPPREQVVRWYKRKPDPRAEAGPLPRP